MFKRAKEVFIPHKHNDYKPHFFREWSVLLVATVILLLFLLSTLLQYNLQLNSSMLANVISSVVVDLTNEDRLSSGLGTLTINDKLAQAAQLKANDMAAKGYFAHTSPDGHSPWYWFSQAGYDFQNAGENLAVHFSDSHAVTEAWMNSPTHRANILNGTFTEIGIATAEGYYQGFRTTFVVQMFGSPRVIAATEPSTAAVAMTPETDASVQGATFEETTITPEEPVATTVETARVDTRNQQFVAVAATEKYSSSIDRALVSPRHTFQYILFGAGVVIVLALLIMIGVEIKRQHLRHIIYGILLLLLVAILYYISQHGFLVSEVLVL